jgi:hypothetical protein
MNKIKNKREKENIIVLLTYKSMYLISKNYNLIKNYSLKNLQSVITIQSNSSFIILQFQLKDDKLNIILESIRRTEFLVYLKLS